MNPPCELRPQRCRQRIDMGLAVRGGQEADFKGARRQIDPVFEQRVKRRLEARARVGRKAARRAHRRGGRSLLREAEPEDRADALHGQRWDPGQGVLEARAEGFELLIDTAIEQLLQRCESGAHRERIGAQGAGLVDRSGRRHELHQLAPAAVGTDRKAAADDLAVGDEIRVYAAVAGVALEADAEA